MKNDFFNKLEEIANKIFNLHKTLSLAIFTTGGIYQMIKLNRHGLYIDFFSITQVANDAVIFLLLSLLYLFSSACLIAIIKLKNIKLIFKIVIVFFLYVSCIVFVWEMDLFNIYAETNWPITLMINTIPLLIPIIIFFTHRQESTLIPGLFLFVLSILFPLFTYKTTGTIYYYNSDNNIQAAELHYKNDKYGIISNQNSDKTFVMPISNIERYSR